MLLLVATLSVITTATSIASFLTMRAMKRDYDAALEVMRPFTQGIAAANKLMGSGSKT
jgi:predicted cation transporter